jgi:hypothetical protein
MVVLDVFALLASLTMTKPAQYPEIPLGSYCYSAAGTCPHLVTKTVNGVDLPWCRHLKLGSVPASGLRQSERESLIEAWGEWRMPEDSIQSAVDDGHFESLEAARACRSFAEPKEFGLFLLWDQCKECGESDRSPARWYAMGPDPLPKYPNYVIEFVVSGKLPERKYQSDFNLWVKVPKDIPNGEQLRVVLRFLRRVPAICRRLQLVGGALSFQGERLEMERYPTNPVGFAHRVLLLTRKLKKKRS